MAKLPLLSPHIVKRRLILCKRLRQPLDCCIVHGFFALTRSFGSQFRVSGEPKFYLGRFVSSGSDLNPVVFLIQAIE